MDDNTLLESIVRLVAVRLQYNTICLIIDTVLNCVSCGYCVVLWHIVYWSFHDPPLISTLMLRFSLCVVNYISTSLTLPPAPGKSICIRTLTTPTFHHSILTYYQMLLHNLLLCKKTASLLDSFKNYTFVYVLTLLKVYVYRMFHITTTFYYSLMYVFCVTLDLQFCKNTRGDSSEWVVNWNADDPWWLS